MGMWLFMVSTHTQTVNTQHANNVNYVWLKASQDCWWWLAKAEIKLAILDEPGCHHTTGASSSSLIVTSLEVDSGVNDFPQVWHLALYSSGEGIWTSLSKEKAKYMQTVLLHDNMPSNMSNFKCLRILSLGNVLTTNLSNAISKLIHLRYFDLSNARITILPKYIGKLYNLQTLR
ncbi:hypothetical protein LguiB_009510 [Lonicera macranthoides]